MMLPGLLDLAIGFLVESVLGSSSSLSRKFQRAMHGYLDQRGTSGTPAPPRG
jgi:hypothetical protein